MGKVVAIIQARLGSTRLPGKVLLDLAGEPMLARVVHRLRRAERVHEVVIATTTERRDDALERLCAERAWPCFRGSENDVLDRFYQTALAHRAEVVVRITSDCPFIDPAVIDSAIEGLDLQQSDYSSNALRRTYPRGLDVEAFTFATLETAWREDRNPAWREHVTQFIVNHPERFGLTNLSYDIDHSALRWTVDTPEDFAFAEKVYAHFGRDDFGWEEVLPVLAEHPEWSEINRDVVQKAV
jgi:spore coat polysaccharide biosynthesis protein SpsF